MDLLSYLKSSAGKLVNEASTSVSRAHLTHYTEAGPEKVRERIQALFDRIVESLELRDLGPVVDHARTIANERFAAGFDLSEVQVAFNVLEEVVWLHVMKHFPPSDFATAIGLMSTVVGQGKDMLAVTYVSLATKSHCASLNLKALFAGATS